MLRVMIFDRFDQPLGELPPDRVFALSRHEEVNGEHSLEITTTEVLQQGWRVLTRDGRGKWREHVVYGTDALHESGDRPIGTYYCVWSVQPDLMGTRVSRMPGEKSPVTAGVALGYALEGTARWKAGTVTNASTGGASMYDTDGWDAVSILVENWGGEVEPRIEAGPAGVTARYVDYFAQQGDQEPKRRFDFAEDLKSVRRKVEDGPLYCRITPRGRGEETDAGGYGRKITIESVNGGRDYLENPAMVDLAKLPDGSGGWEYPTLEVENPDCETPEELLEWARSVLEDYTAPRVTYEVDALQLAREGVDLHGASLGDAVQVVDGKFGDGLRVTGRVAAMTVNMLDERDCQLVIGHLDGGLAGLFGSLQGDVGSLLATVKGMNGGTMSTADYLSRLLDRINAEVNATGGYTYIAEGQGLRTYDKAVSDPLVGSEASSVVELKGGAVRIANSKTAQGEWEWKTVFTSGHIAANLVTAAQLVAGYIGSPSGNYWNLDTGELRMASTATVGGKTVDAIAKGAADSALAEFVNGDYADDLQAIGEQIDGKAETWYQSSDPSAAWTTAALKSEHAGDLWYRTTDHTTWRYSGAAWVEQKAPDDVFDKIDGKAQIFVSQPKPPYNVGDLWFNSSSSDIMTCTAARASGSYAASDWSKRNKYTDDSAVTTLDNSLNQKEVFNRLTNNGTAQGIFLENGNLYINGKYIKADTFESVLTKGIDGFIFYDDSGLWFDNKWRYSIGYGGLRLYNTTRDKNAGFLMPFVTSDGKFGVSLSMSSASTQPWGFKAYEDQSAEINAVGLLLNLNYTGADLKVKKNSTEYTGQTTTLTVPGYWLTFVGGLLVDVQART